MGTDAGSGQPRQGLRHEGPEEVPPGVDTSVPSAGRMYDYFLNGRQWYPVDVEAAQRVLRVVPETHYLAHANRSFVQLATGALAREHGVRQFIDLGSGIPTQFNSHQVAHVVDRDIPVVYVDNDPQVLFHGEYLLRRAGETRVAMVEGDACDPGSVLDNAHVRELIDFSQPVGMLHCAVWHFVPDDHNPWALIREYMDAVVPGSFLALSHVTAEGQRPEKVARFKEVYDGASASLHFRTIEQIDRMFTSAGLEYLPPYRGADAALSFVDVWGSKNPAEANPAHTWLPAGVAMKV
jgi:hypothetical protein